jgi:hypothetical protein
MTPSKTDLVELMRADRLVQIKRQVEQAVVDLQGRRGILPGAIPCSETDRSHFAPTVLYTD